MICLQLPNVRTKTWSEYIPAAEDRLHCFGGIVLPDNDVKTGPGSGFTDSRSRLLIAVNLGAGQVLFSWNFRLFRLFSAFKLNWRICVNCAFHKWVVCDDFPAVVLNSWMREDETESRRDH